MELYDINQIEALLKRHGFHFSKALGQNFLTDPDVCPAMAEVAIPDDSYGVLEIGPGIGVLTVELAKRAAKVVSVELDERLLPILEETLAPFANVKVVPGDILKLDLHQLLAEEFGNRPVVVCANLPYYITSPIITHLLQEQLPIRSLTVMVQAEAAERLCAEMGTREAGAITAAIRYYAQPERLFVVPKESFVPSPKVTSEVIRLTLLPEPPVQLDNEQAFFRMVKAGFTQRRKTILNSFSSCLHLSKEELRSVLAELNIPETARIEQLSLDDLIRIYQHTNSST